MTQNSTHASLRRRLLELAFPAPPGGETPVRFILRVVAGLVFLATGMMKLAGSIVLGSAIQNLPVGIPGFAMYLSAVGVPAPLLAAAAVTILEVGGALVLLASAFWSPAARLTRPVSLGLAVDMLVAIVTVGLRNLAGHPVLMQGLPVTYQAWRLPLEAAMLVISLFFLRFPTPGATRDVRRASRSTNPTDVTL